MENSKFVYMKIIEGYDQLIFDIYTYMYYL